MGKDSEKIPKQRRRQREAFCDSVGFPRRDSDLQQIQQAIGGAALGLGTSVPAGCPPLVESHEPGQECVAQMTGSHPVQPFGDWTLSPPPSAVLGALHGGRPEAPCTSVPMTALPLSLQASPWTLRGSGSEGFAKRLPHWKPP